MDTTPYRCAARFVVYTLAMTAALLAPAVLQAVVLLQPGTFTTQHAAAVMSGALAAATVIIPALLASLLDHRGLPP